MRKKILFLAIMMLMMVCMQVSAQSNDLDNVTVQVTLNNGSKINGKLIDATFANFLEPSYGYYLNTLQSVKVSTQRGKKEVTYDANDVKSLKLTSNGESTEYLSLYIIKNFTWPKNLIPGNTKHFWPVVYKGKNIIGFGLLANQTSVVGISSYVHRHSMAFAYCKKGDAVAVVYYVPMKGASGEKAIMRRCFARFPNMHDYLKSKDFSWKEFKKNPLSVLTTLEEKL